MKWRCRERELSGDGFPAVMGILNVTPDSFSDGGRFTGLEQAVAQGHRLAVEGAAILDVGGESTRPGAEPVDTREELRRVIPVVEALAAALPHVLLSIDTMKAEVAREALRAGAHIVNDVSALTHDPDMLGVAAESGAGVILMHMRGAPRTMQADPVYDDVVAETATWLEARIAAARDGGIAMAALAVDPGIGFGKTLAHNLAIMGNLHAYTRLERPLVVGASRKSFLGRLTGRETADRLAGSLAAAACAVMQGAHILRVHDAGATADACHVAAAIAGASAGKGRAC